IAKDGRRPEDEQLRRKKGSELTKKSKEQDHW
ncbi:hypothetical protein AVEN_216095-1, partial [Araneus ventricosus]